MCRPDPAPDPSDTPLHPGGLVVRVISGIYVVKVEHIPASRIGIYLIPESWQAMAGTLSRDGHWWMAGCAETRNSKSEAIVAAVQSAEWVARDVARRAESELALGSPTEIGASAIAATEVLAGDLDRRRATEDDDLDRDLAAWGDPLPWERG